MQVTLPDISDILNVNRKNLYYLYVQFLNVNIRENAININGREHAININVREHAININIGENAININIRNFYTAPIRFVPLKKVKHRGRIREVMHFYPRKKGSSIER